MRAVCIVIVIMGLFCVTYAQQPAAREFTNQQGRTLTASVVDFDGDKVGFLLPSGATKYCSIEELSEPDQTFLRNHALYHLPKVILNVDAPYAIQDQNEEIAYIDHHGDKKFNARWKSKTQFVGSYAHVAFSGGSSGFVDTNGKTVFRSKDAWSVRGEMDDDLILMANVSTGKYKFVDRKGRNPLKQEFMQAHRMRHGVAWVSRQWPSSSEEDPYTSWKLINKEGEEIFALPPLGELVDKIFHGELARVINNKKDKNSITYVHVKGESINLEMTKKNTAPQFFGQYAVFQNGVIDTEGNYTLKPSADYRLLTDRVTEGVVIGVKGKFYSILSAKSGKELAILPFGVKPANEGSQSGLIRVTDSSDPRRYGFLNREGKWVVQPQFILAKPFENGFAHVRLADFKTNAVINTQGKVIYKEIFKGKK